VQALPEQQREVFVLYEVEGLSGVEIAAALDVPLNTVWTRLHRARPAFRALWTAGESP
jgi:RNA polymerase sigma-70 factor (ECF subfamily)